MPAVYLPTMLCSSDYEWFFPLTYLSTRRYLFNSTTSVRADSSILVCDACWQFARSWNGAYTTILYVQAIEPPQEGGGGRCTTRFASLAWLEYEPAWGHLRLFFFFLVFMSTTGYDTAVNPTVMSLNTVIFFIFKPNKIWPYFEGRRDWCASRRGNKGV